LFISTEGEGAGRLPEIAEAVYSLNTGEPSTSVSKTASTPTASSTPTSTTSEEGEQDAESEDEQKGIPGFEAMFAIVGLWVVVYLIRGKGN